MANPQGVKPDPKNPSRKPTPAPVTGSQVRGQLQRGADADGATTSAPSYCATAAT
jgi:hypothetical protein